MENNREADQDIIRLRNERKSELKKAMQTIWSLHDDLERKESEVISIQAKYKEQHKDVLDQLQQWKDQASHLEAELRRCKDDSEEKIRQLEAQLVSLEPFEKSDEAATGKPNESSLPKHLNGRTTLGLFNGDQPAGVRSDDYAALQMELDAKIQENKELSQRYQHVLMDVKSRDEVIKMKIDDCKTLQRQIDRLQQQKPKDPGILSDGETKRAWAQAGDFPQVEYDQLLEKYTLQTKELESKITAIESIKKKLSSLRDELQQTRKDLDEKDRIIAQNTAEKNQLRRDVAELQGQLERLRATNSDTEARLKKSMYPSEQLQQLVRGVDQDGRSGSRARLHEEELRAKEQTIQEQKREIDQLKSRGRNNADTKVYQDLVRSEEKLKEAQTSIERLKQLLAGLQADNDAKKSELSGKAAAYDSLKSEVVKLRAELDKSATSSHVAKHSKHFEGKITELESDVVAYQKQAQEYEKDFREEAQLRESAERECEELRAEVRTLKQRVDDLTAVEVRSKHRDYDLGGRWKVPSAAATRSTQSDLRSKPAPMKAHHDIASRWDTGTTPPSKTAAAAPSSKPIPAFKSRDELDVRGDSSVRNQAFRRTGSDRDRSRRTPATNVDDDLLGSRFGTGSDSLKISRPAYQDPYARYQSDYGAKPAAYSPSKMSQFAWLDEMPRCPVCNVLFASRFVLEEHLPYCIK